MMYSTQASLEYNKDKIFGKIPKKQKNGLWKWGKKIQAAAYNGAHTVYI